MMDLVKLAQIPEPADGRLPSSSHGYLCGPMTFRALLQKTGLNWSGKTRFEVNAGVRKVVITLNSHVPDDGKFYPWDSSLLDDPRR